MNPKNNISMRGFTLVELLIIIVVIAMLGAMLTPALHSAMSAAYTSVCMANMRAVANGCAIYVDNNNGFVFI